MNKILVTGGSGQLGLSFFNVIRDKQDDDFSKIGTFYFTLSRHSEIAPLDITDYNSVEEYVKRNEIDCIVNFAAYTNVDGAEDNYKDAYNCNCKGVKNLADICRENNAKLIHISTDYVFNGEKATPYKSYDKINPKTNYGGSKSLGESAIKTSGCDYMIIRTSWLYSEYGKNFFKTMLDLFDKKDELNVVFDQIGSPTYAIDLARFIYHIISNNLFKNGIYHFSNKGVASWYDFTKEIYSYSNEYMLSGEDTFKCKKINCCLSTEFVQKAKRPNYSVLDCSETEKAFGYEIRYWKDALRECIERYTLEKI